MPLTPELILSAYRRGLFPMADPEDESIGWYDADPRGIIPLDAPHVPRRLRRYMKQFEFAFDRNFEGVIDGCARPVTWISREIREVYVALHRQGHAHSVEAWKDGKLAGGLYGVHIAGAFMAESMFHAVSNASGACVIHLVEHLQERGFVLLDIQQVLPNTARLGGVEVSRKEYLRRLGEALKLSPKWIG
ncbi:MAG TPA: leucyl/phenylalanyl-tRNA--protein transferase [Planctomycetota bacterium]|nr:leucyl/phenylalanyl-tRNA--protein transferase [Planctomycetota bacterium]